MIRRVKLKSPPPSSPTLYQVPTKKTKFLHSHVVDYFAGNKAVDLLMQVGLGF